MSFACPHFEPDTDTCQRVRCECVPGRPGCGISKSSVFAVPWEERLKAKLEEKRLAALASDHPITPSAKSPQANANQTR